MKLEFVPVASQSKVRRSKGAYFLDSEKGNTFLPVESALELIVGFCVFIATIIFGILAWLTKIKKEPVLNREHRVADYFFIAELVAVLHSVIEDRDKGSYFQEIRRTIRKEFHLFLSWFELFPKELL